MSVYTHNLKIILVDTSGNIVLDNDFLEEIKNELCKSNTKDVKWNMKNIKITLQWEKKELNNIEKHLIGDLFLNSIYDYDSIIVNHTTQVISSINKKSNYSIKSYISRCIGDKKVCSDSYGII